MPILNIIIASFHNQLKTTYLNGKVNRRYEKDAFFRYKRDRQLPPAMHKKAQQEINHHQRSLKIPVTKVKAGDTNYLSASDSSISYVYHNIIIIAMKAFIEEITQSGAK